MDNINPDPANIPDDDLHLRGYQDDLDTGSSITDAATHNLTDDPTETFGIDPKEFKKELDHYDFDNSNDSEDDRREDIESRDMDIDQEA
jgi:hypothetical protein